MSIHKKGLLILLVAFGLTCMTGCIKLSGTPIVGTVQMVPSEIIKSKLIGESCGDVHSFGASGDLSLGELLKNSKISKITYVDYDLKFSIFKGNICMRVYGY